MKFLKIELVERQNKFKSAVQVRDTLIETNPVYIKLAQNNVDNQMALLKYCIKICKEVGINTEDAVRILSGKFDFTY